MAQQVACRPVGSRPIRQVAPLEAVPSDSRSRQPAGCTYNQFPSGFRSHSTGYLREALALVKLRLGRDSPHVLHASAVRITRFQDPTAAVEAHLNAVGRTQSQRL